VDKLPLNKQNLGRIPIEEDYMNKQDWLAQKYPKNEERMQRYSTISDMEIEPIYTPDDQNGRDDSKDIGLPGEYPYTRGV